MENNNPSQQDPQGEVQAPENTTLPKATEPIVTDDGETIVSPATVAAVDAVSAPGTGIDTDGDGDANLVTQPGDAPPVEVHVDHEDDYKNQVKLGMGNVVSKKTAKKLVKESGINQHFKDKMYDQIKEGEFQPPFDETFKRIKTASDNGTVYRPGSEGL